MLEGTLSEIGCSRNQQHSIRTTNTIAKDVIGFRKSLLAVSETTAITQLHTSSNSEQKWLTPAKT